MLFYVHDSCCPQGKTWMSRAFRGTWMWTRCLRGLPVRGFGDVQTVSSTTSL